MLWYFSNVFGGLCWMLSVNCAPEWIWITSNWLSCTTLNSWLCRRFSYMYSNLFNADVVSLYFVSLPRWFLFSRAPMHCCLMGLFFCLSVSIWFVFCGISVSLWIVCVYLLFLLRIITVVLLRHLFNYIFWLLVYIRWIYCSKLFRMLNALMSNF